MQLKVNKNKLTVDNRDLDYTVWVPVQVSKEAIKQWLEQHARGEWTVSWAPGTTRSHSRRYVFELETDALWFSLRWQ
jgi:hypothetical protein